MRSMRYAAFLLLALAAVGSAQTWVTAPDNSSCAWQRYDAEYFPGTNMVYFLCGRVNTTYYNTVYSFDAVSGTYTNTGATMPNAVVNWDVSYLQDDYNLSAGDTYGLYVVGGNNASGIQTAMQVYHPRSNTSADMTTDPVPLRSTTGYVVTGTCAVTVNNKIYAFGGFNNADYSNCDQTWTYDPTLSAGARWQQITTANLSAGRAYIAGAIVDNYIYAIGGAAGSGATLVPSTVVERLDVDDPDAGWVVVSSLPSATDETRAFGFGASSSYGWQNQIIVAGQGQWPNEYANCYIYSTTGDNWNTFSSLNLFRRNHAGAFIPPEGMANGVPAMWVWGGRYTSDANVRITPEVCYPKPTASVTSPVGGEVWVGGSVHDITWTSTLSATDSIVYSTNNGSTWSYVGKQSPPSSRSFAWTVPNTPSTNCLVRVLALNPSAKDTGQSASVFTIVLVPTVGVTSPNGGEQWEVGVTHDVTWTSANSTTDSVVYTDGANTYYIGKEAPPASRRIAWAVPNTPGANWRVVVFAIGAGGTTSAQSAAPFSIIVAASGVSVIAPTGGESWQAGVSHNITWTSSASATDSLAYSTDGGSSWSYVGKESPPSARSFAWTVPNTPSSNCLVKVLALSGDPLAPPVSAESPSPFSIVAVPTAAVTSPNGGEKWQEGIVHSVNWTGSGSAADSVVYTDGANYYVIGVQRPVGSRSIAWTVPSTLGTNWRVRVMAMSADGQAPPVSDQSDNPFSIVAAPIVGSLIPNGGEFWPIGSHHNITWASTNSITDSIVFARDGANWVFVNKQSPPTTRSFDWNVPAPASATCRVRVFALSGDPLGGASVQSASDFSITGPLAVMVTVPNGGEAWPAGSTQNITWTSANSSTDSIVWSLDNGASWSYVGKESPPATRSFAWTVPMSPGTQNLVRVFAVGSGTSLFDQSNGTFSILSADAGWTRKPDLLPGGKSKGVKDGAVLSYAAGPRGDSDFVYALKGNNTYEFYRYSSLSNAWAVRESIPAINRLSKKKAVKKGSSLATVRKKFGGSPPDWQVSLYATKGNGTYDFWHYDPAGGGWAQKADVPVGAKKVKEGTSAVHVSIHYSGPDADSNFVYLLKGSSTFEFYRYNTETDLWSAPLANAPGGASGKPYKNGSSIAYDGGDTIWCLKGSYNEFAAYSISGNNWVTKELLPFVAPPGTKKAKVKDGSGTAAVGRTVYALKGGNTNELWYFFADANHWAHGTDLTVGLKKVKGGGALTYSDGDEALYAFRGNGTREFWHYGPVASFDVFAANSGPKAVQGLTALPRTEFALRIAPNPFARAAAITYSLPEAGAVSLKLYDVSGKLVTVLARGNATAGSHGALVDAEKLARGIYLLKFESENYTTTEKLIIE